MCGCAAAYRACIYVKRHVSRAISMSKQIDDLELPLGKRTKSYRFFEMLPGLLTYSMLSLLIILSFLQPLLAAIYILLVILALFVRSLGIAYRTIHGHSQLVAAEKINWRQRVQDLAAARKGGLPDRQFSKKEFEAKRHREILQSILNKNLEIPDPQKIYHAVIIAAYNESYDVIQPTVESVKATSYDNKNLIVYLAYEERGGEDIEQTARRLKKEYASVFKAFQIVKHPKDLPEEIPGKGPNITFAGKKLQEWCNQQNIPYDDVIVTTLDSDNRPYKSYFDYVSYEYLVHTNRERLSYQPIALYFGNIWDAPAPMRVLATGNSFWTIISSMRPHTLRNFAAHSQPLTALIKMNFWSKRSIVEDGHQYWRSYFYYRGDYGVVPIHVPIYQDAVMADTLKKTMVAQFKQLRRWGYGASDVPYVATRLFTRQRTVPFWEGFARFWRLLDGHVSLASTAIIVAVGGWIPLLVNREASRNYTVHSLPTVVSYIQTVAMIGIFITIFLMLKMLPPRPERYKRRRTIAMVLQWILMPITSVCYSAFAAINAQTHLLFGRYLETFDVTDKATLASREKAKKQRQAEKSQKKKKR